MGESGDPTPRYIYCLSDPRDGAVRYIGETRSPKQRLAGHVGSCRRGPSFPAKDWVRSLVMADLRPKMDLLGEVRGVDRMWSNPEWLCIDRAVRAGHALLNIQYHPGRRAS